MCLPYLTAPDPVTEEVTEEPSANGQRRLKKVVEIEDDASNPGRIEVVSTTDFQVPPPYIYWKTVRLRHVDGKNKEGVPSEKVDALMVLRRKCVIFLTETLVLTAFLQQQQLVQLVKIEARMPLIWVSTGGFIPIPISYYQLLPRRVD